MKPIRKITKRNLKKVLKVSLTSYEFERKLIGDWMRKPSGKKRSGKKQLQERRTAAKKKNRKRLTRFRWFVNNMEG